MEAELTHFATNFELDRHGIGPGSPCFIIAEGGVNHFGDIDKAFALIDLATDAGADAFKTQHFKTDLLVGPSAPDWRERLRSKELPDEAILRMRDYCEKRGITFLCTPHDEAALAFLEEEVGVPGYKIGSGEVENWPYLARIAALGKPVLLSTGMYKLDQIDEAAKAMADAGCSELAVLHCITSYPADPSVSKFANSIPGPSAIRIIRKAPRYRWRPWPLEPTSSRSTSPSIVTSPMHKTGKSPAIRAILRNLSPTFGKSNPPEAGCRKSSTVRSTQPSCGPARA